MLYFQRCFVGWQTFNAQNDPYAVARR